MEARDIENLQPFGYINTDNILIDSNDDFHVIDYAGNPDPFPTAEPYTPQEKDTTSQEFRDNELSLFKQGLIEIQANQEKDPKFYRNLYATMDVVMAIGSA